jgi:HK97 family phage portal protein
LKFNIFGKTIEIKNAVSSLPDPRNEEAWSTYLSGKGYHVSANTAIKVAAVIRCVIVVAETMASLPLNLFRTTANGREKATDHPLYEILYRLPNPETTAFDFWLMYIANLMLTRGAFAKIKRDRNGFIRSLWNIPTANVSKIKRNSINGERYITVYLQNRNGQIVTENLREGEFMYTPNLRFSSVDDPEDPISIASDVLGLTMALNGFAKDYFENGSNLGGFVECPAEAEAEKAYKLFKESWNEMYAGVRNQHKVAFLGGGSKFNAITKNPNDSQALESRKFAVIETCRIFGVPPHKVYELDRATFNNIEELNIEFVQEALTPMAVRLEQTHYKDLLTTEERKTLYTKWNLNGLLRGNIAARSAYYHNMRNDGVMNADEIRELEDMNDQPDGLGKIYFINGNMLNIEKAKDNLPKSLQNGGNK